MLKVNKPNIVALLPMKLNSTRVPSKNFKNLCGKPLCEWIVNSLIASNRFEYIVINTDAREALKNTAIYPDKRILIRDRPVEICGDEVSMNLVIGDDLENVDADIYFMTHTTNPLLRPDTIGAAIDAYVEAKRTSNIDSLFSVNKYQARFYDSNTKPLNHDLMNLIPTQNLEPWYEENSNFYIFTKQSFEASGGRIGLNPMMFEMDKSESIDIDTQEDWNLAARLMEHHLDA